MDILIKFIKENDLSFIVGERNTNIVVLCGYTHYLNDTEKVYDLREEDILEAIEKSNVYFENIDEISTEIYRLFDYTYINNYENYWYSEEAQNNYVYEQIEENA